MKLKFSFLLVLTLLIVNSSLLITHATIRFVSKSGTSTPPYTSWQTAADSIQKCINICVDDDTVYVANGIYKEFLIINPSISLFGMSMDSTVIDGRNLGEYYTIRAYADQTIVGFTVIGKGISDGIQNTVIATLTHNLDIINCRISNANNGIYIGSSSGTIDQLIMNDLKRGLMIEDPADTSHPSFTNSIIITKDNGISPSVYLSFGGNPKIQGNIIIEESRNYDQTLRGISSDYTRGMSIKNNLVAGYKSANIKVGQVGEDTAYIINNTSLYTAPLTTVQNGSIVINSGEKTVLKNNIIAHGYRGVYCYGLSVTPEYNLYWDLSRLTGGNANAGTGNFYADPMFVNDTIPTANGNNNFQFQKYSPAIDTGDPNILDKDSSRSDIGIYGGPFGDTYTYQDLAPLAPRNLSAVVDTNEIILKWNRNTEADTAYYKVYRDTVVSFQIDSTKLISSQTDTSFIQTIPLKASKYVYKITCMDNQGNESKPSEEVVVDLTYVSTNDYPMTINDYLLYQNYPNPFNPSTKIGYKLKERAYIKLMVYDIKGELITVLVNKEQNAGYFEADFSVISHQSTVGNLIASGIYLYRIEVIGKGNIPVYSEMKKMILIK